jgi:hypothetical protein
MRLTVLVLGVLMFASVAGAQSRVGDAPANSPAPLTGEGRVAWVVAGNASPRSLLAGVVVAGWNTLIDTPPEWQKTWGGFGKRYVAREGNVAVSNGIEAGVGALWDEDPRYVRADAESTFMARVGHAVRYAIVARRHGREIPAYARYGANVSTVFIAESWLPPSASTAGNRTMRIGSAIGGRALANLWQEFWPDVAAKLRR